MMRFAFFGAALLLWNSNSFGAVVLLTAADINGADTNRTFFDNGEIRLTPLIRDAAGVPQPATFNANAARLGIDGNGTNNNAFNDANTTFGDLGDELLRFELGPTSALTQISYDFSRANGSTPNSGIFISGFLSNPNVTGSGNLTATTQSFNATTNTLRLLTNSFSGTATFINFDPQASVGQTLTLRINDEGQAGAQLAIRSISYDNAIVAIPEPSSVAMIGLLCGAGILRHRRRNRSV